MAAGTGPRAIGTPDDTQGGPVKLSLDGWDVNKAEELEWVPWGSTGDTRAKVLGSADGYVVVLVEADPGYRGDPHEHTNAEFFYLVDGTVENQGQAMKPGDGYAAAAGSTHADFSTPSGATYIISLKL